LENSGKQEFKGLTPRLRSLSKYQLAVSPQSLLHSSPHGITHPPSIFPPRPSRMDNQNPQPPSPPVPYSSSPSTWPRALSGPSVFFFGPTSLYSSAFIGVLVWLPDMNSAWAPWWYGVSEIGKVVEGGPPKFIPLFPKTHFRDFQYLILPLRSDHLRNGIPSAGFPANADLRNALNPPLILFLPHLRQVPFQPRNDTTI
jgi:hypothetical protein